MAKLPARFFAKVDSGNGHLLIYDDIGSGFMTEGVTAKGVTSSLEEMKAAGARDLHIYINSPGGDVFEGNAIYNVIARWPGKKVVHVDGLAASMASVIAMVGDEIEISSNAITMIHDPWGVVAGDSADLRERADLLDKLGETILDTYANRTKQPRENLKAMMAEETWMDANESVRLGFADRVAAESKIDSGDMMAAAARWPILAKFKKAPEQVVGLLSSQRVLETVAIDRTEEPRCAVTTEEAKMPDNKPENSGSVTLTAEQFEKLVARQSPAVATTASSPVSEVVAQASSAPVIAKFSRPKALDHREEMSDESASSDVVRRALPMARAACASIIAKDRGMKLEDAADMLGFRKTAEKIAMGASMSVGDADTGGSFVHTAIQQGFIDMLDSAPGIVNLIPAGSRIRASVPQIQFDTLTSGCTGGWVGENPTTGAPEALGTGSKVLTARKQRVEVLISRELLRSVSNVDQIVLQKMILRSKQLDDLAFVEGTGSAYQPRGLEVINANGLGQSGTTYDAAYSDLLGCLKRIALKKVPEEAGRAFIIPEQYKWGLMGLDNATDLHPFRDEVQAGTLFGKPFASSSLIGTDKVYCFAPGEAIWFEQLAMLLESDSTYINASGTSVSASGSDQAVVRLWRKVACDLQHDDAMSHIYSATLGA